MAREHGLDLIVHTNQEGVAQGINPFDHGSAVLHRHHEDRRAQAGARQARLRRRLRRRPPRRGEVAREGAGLLVPHRAAPLGPQEPAARAVERSTTPARRPANRSASSRCRTGPSSTSGTTSTASRSRSCRSTSRPSARSCERDGTLIMVDDERMPLEPGEQPAAAQGPLPHARLLSADRRDRERPRPRCRRSSRRCCSPTTSERQGRVIDHDQAGSMERKKQEGYF